MRRRSGRFRKKIECVFLQPSFFLFSFSLHLVWDKEGQQSNAGNKCCAPFSSFWNFFSPSLHSIRATLHSSLECFAESLTGFDALRVAFGLLQQMLCDRKRNWYLHKAILLILSLIWNLWRLHRFLLHAGKNEILYINHQIKFYSDKFGKI